MIGAGWTQGALRAKAGLERRGLRGAENFLGNSGFSVIKKVSYLTPFQKIQVSNFLPIIAY